MNSQLTLAAHILAVLDHHKHDGAITSEVLAEGFGTNPVVVRRVLAQLKRAGLVASRPGAGGGSMLAKPADQITMRDAYLAVSDGEGRVLGRRPKRCKDGQSVAPLIADYLNDVYKESEVVLLEKLGEITVPKLMQELGKRMQSQPTK